MPYSTTLYKEEIKQHIIKNMHSNANILDVGAGCGTYAHLLREHFKNIDAIEIHQPNIDKFELKKLYKQVYLGDILTSTLPDYQYYIFGDVIEHMSVKDAQKLLRLLNDKGALCLVGVPYCYEQGEYEGNTYEIHLQPDLTKELFLERYPWMHHLMGDNSYGYFVNYDYIVEYR